jgi:nondiscriminating glutamyl-tRNA synthetase
MSSPIRTRFAPSPTGHLHIGNARTALLNWIVARHAGGHFILRIEDTDQERSTPASERSILDDLNWLGLNPDEGPDSGGQQGPYRQSERKAIYIEHLDSLTVNGQAYPCYCTAQELEARRKEQLKRGEAARYNGHCRNLSDSDRKKYEESGRKPAFRFKTDADSVCFEDRVRGTVKTPGDQLGDFIIARADLTPMYNFACVIDDHLMQISHVIRGDDHVSNTPRQILLYEALGWKPPQFAHIPMILGPDRQRLSKRHGATSVDQCREQGYLADALVNFLSLLSWSSESGDEILDRQRLISEFSFERLSRAAAIFDTEKLNWMNGVYIREKTPPETLVQMVRPFFEKSGFPTEDENKLAAIVRVLQKKIEKLAEIPLQARFFFEESVSPENAEAAGVLKNPESQRVFKTFLSETSALTQVNSDIFNRVMKTVQMQSAIKGRALWMPVRVALTGQLHGPDLGAVAEILGLEKCRSRIHQAIG